MNHHVGQRILDVLLERPAQRTRAIRAVTGRLLQNVFSGILIETDANLLDRQILVDVLHLQADNLDQVLVVQRRKQDDLVEPIEELRVEGAFHFRHHLIFHLGRNAIRGRRVEADALLLIEEAGTQIRRHDDHAVFEVDRVAEAIGQLPVFKDLQQNVVDVRMRLLDFVEQNDRIRIALHALRQLAALLITDIAGGRTDQLGHRMLLHKLRHVEADQILFAAKEELGESAGDFGFTDAGGSEEQEGAGRPLGRLESGARTANGAGQGRNRFLLADDALVELILHAQQFRDLFFFDRRHRHAGPARHHVFDVVFGHHASGGVVEIVLFAKLAQVIALFALFVRVETSLLELVIGDRILHAMHDELDPLLHFGHVGRQRGLLQLHARPGFVDQVDRFIRQEAIGNEAAGGVNRRLNGFVGVDDGVELLVALLDAVHDLDGVDLIGRRHLHGLKAAFERPVLLDRLAELSRRRGADALNLAAGKGRLQDVGRVERAFGRTRADQRMQFVDEDDGVLIIHQLFHDRLQALFELTAILGAGHDQRKVERQNSLIGEERRHVAVGDLLSQAFDDGRLADARLANQHRIVLGAAAENLNYPFQLFVAPDQRIYLAVDRRLGQVAAELGQ